MEQEKKVNGVENQEKTYSEAQFAGLLADKQAEVRKRQEAEKRVSDLEAELEKLKNVDPHAPGAQGQIDPDERPLTINELANLLGIEPDETGEKTTPKTGGKVAGDVPGISLGWLNRSRNKPVVQMSDAELDKLAEDITLPQTATD